MTNPNPNPKPKPRPKPKPNPDPNPNPNPNPEPDPNPNQVAVEHDPFSDGRLGPPFNVSEVQVRELFGEDFAVELLQREDRLDLCRKQGAHRGCVWPEWRRAGVTSARGCRPRLPQALACLGQSVGPRWPAISGLFLYTGFELEPTWRKRGCTHFAEVAYLLTRRRPRVS